VLDFDEFIGASRSDLKIDVDTVSDADIKRIFASVDLDGSGEISAEELLEWLGKNKRSSGQHTQKQGFFEQLVDRFISAAKAKVNDLGWKQMWTKYDKDSSDELDPGEFIECIRAECSFSESDISDEELQEVFRLIDADGSDALSSQEFSAALLDESDDKSLSYLEFKRSMFEMVDVWADGLSEPAYVAFLDTVFGAIVDVDGADDAVRARPGRLSALSVSHSKSILYGACAWTRRALNGPKRFSGRAEGPLRGCRSVERGGGRGKSRSPDIPPDGPRANRVFHQRSQWEVSRAN
jgi:Ca2+-binding EF-hand superfamily protein